MIYLEALSEDGKNIDFSLVEQQNGQQLLVGPNIHSFLRSCKTVNQELMDTMHNDLITRIANGDTLSRTVLRQLHVKAASAKKLSLERFSCLVPLTNYENMYAANWQGVSSSTLRSSMLLLNIRFPGLCRLELGIDVLEFLVTASNVPYYATVHTIIPKFMERQSGRLNRGTYETDMDGILERSFDSLRAHPNVCELHIRIVWKTFLEDLMRRRAEFDHRDFEEELREQLRGHAVELVRAKVPDAASVTACVEGEE